jgi:hypothetical protein
MFSVNVRIIVMPEKTLRDGMILFLLPKMPLYGSKSLLQLAEIVVRPFFVLGMVQTDTFPNMDSINILNMTTNEKLIDRLGQITFCLETRLSFLRTHNYDSDKTKVEEVQSEIQKDIERLKICKEDMQNKL